MIDVQPIPYSLHNDPLVTSLLLVSFIIVALAFGTTRDYLSREVKSFLYTKDYSSFYNSSAEVNFLLLLCIQSIIMFALSAYIILGKGSVWAMLGIVAAYIFAKYLLYYIVNSTFFERRDVSNWDHVFTMITVIEGIVFLPIILLQVYVGWPVKITIICLAATIILTKILTIFKSFFIFFSRFGGFLQIILYFCTLEVIPCLILYGIIKNIIG
ncbi:MAG: DUF4271 domain-containing protein [Bacteroidaceae bacterium]|nr:DUF4271 domain-containing protein [Bacteroidaceae bacterium]